MCEICTSGASHTGKSVAYAIRAEKAWPGRGNMWRCVECGQLSFPDELQTGNCPRFNCGHQVIEVQLASNPRLLELRGSFVKVGVYDQTVTGYQPQNSKQVVVFLENNE